MNAHAAKQSVTTIGIDIGKNTFHLIGMDRRGEIVLRQKFSREHAAMPDRDGGLCRGPSSQSEAPGAGP